VIDLASIVGFEWDDGNARRNEKHGVSESQAEQAFFDSRLLVVTDAHHSQPEPRLHALGVTIDGRLLHITFTLRVKGTRIRVISARDAHRKERQIYESQR
jgi:uncharacterized DUF497 family protein